MDCNRLKSIFFSNMHLKQIVIKNTFWLSVSEIVSRVATILISLWLARSLGAYNFGVLGFALAMSGFLSIVSNLGIDTIVVREFQKLEEKKREILPILSAKLLLGLVAGGATVLASCFLQDKLVRELTMILGLYTFLGAFTGVFKGWLQASQKMQYVAGLNVLETLVFVGLAIVILFLRSNVAYIGWAYVMAAMVSVLVGAMILRYQNYFKSGKFFDWEIIKKYLIWSWPLALNSVFSMVYIQMDSVLMGFWGMMKEVGWYQAAYKILNFMILPGSILATVFYPVIASLLCEKKLDKFKAVSQGFFEAMLGLGIFLAISFCWLSKTLVTWLFRTEFAPAAGASSILALAGGMILIIMFANSLLISNNQQKKVFYTTVVAAMINLILNFILIPRYSIIGAAMATLVSYLYLLVVRCRLLSKSNLMPDIKVIKYFLIGSGGLTVFLYGTQNLQFWVGWKFLIGFGIYILGVLLFRKKIYLINLIFKTFYGK